MLGSTRPYGRAARQRVGARLPRGLSEPAPRRRRRSERRGHASPDWPVRRRRRSLGRRSHRGAGRIHSRPARLDPRGGAPFAPSGRRDAPTTRGRSPACAAPRREQTRPRRRTHASPRSRRNRPRRGCALRRSRSGRRAVSLARTQPLRPGPRAWLRARDHHTMGGFPGLGPGRAHVRQVRARPRRANPRWRPSEPGSS